MNIYSIREAAEYLLDHIDKMGYAINKLDKKIEELEKEIEDLKGMSKHDELYCKNCGCKEVQVDEICPNCGQTQRYF